MAKHTPKPLTPEQRQATETFLVAFGVPKDLARALAQIEPDWPIFVTNEHDALYQVDYFNPTETPWLVSVSDQNGNEYELNVRSLTLEPDDSTRVTETGGESDAKLADETANRPMFGCNDCGSTRLSRNCDCGSTDFTEYPGSEYQARTDA